MQKFLIIATGFNCESYSLNCVRSVLKQTHTNFKAVFISDGSTDKTLKETSVWRIKDQRIAVEIYPENMGAAYRRLEAIRKHSTNENDIIVLLGLDDELTENSLLRIAQEYDAGKWMTYGNWVNQRGVSLPANFLQFDEVTHQNRDYRKVKYRSTAPNTFRRFLFDQIPEEDFKIDGKWIDSTTESEVMFSCLEMCGKEKIGVITEKIYLYNENLPGGTIKRLGVDHKYKIYNQIVNRPKRNLLVR